MAATTLNAVLATGDHASRPAANAVGGGGLYSCTDHDLIYQTDGSSWTTWATLGAAAVTDIVDIPTAEMDDTLVLAPDGAGGVEFRAEAGGGGGGAVLPLDIAPGSPSAWDDEFDGASLDAKWSQITSASGNDAAATVANGWLTFELNTSGTGNASKRVTGYRQPAPTSGEMTNFEVSAKIADTQWNDDARDGVWVANETDNLAHVVGTNWPNGGAGVAMGISGYSESTDWSTFSGYQAGAPAPNSGRPILWVAIRWIDASTTLQFWISEDGVLWTPVATRTSMIRPTKIGLALWSNSNTLDKAHQMAADWFRVRSI